MAFTLQEKALEQARQRYGRKAFTVDHINYRLVGFWRVQPMPFPDSRCIAGKLCMVGMGQTWEAALAELERKAKAL